MRQIDLNLDYEKLAMRGLDAAAVGNTLQAAFYGIIATEIRDLDDLSDEMLRAELIIEPRASSTGQLDSSAAMNKAKPAPRGGRKLTRKPAADARG